MGAVDGSEVGLVVLGDNVGCDEGNDDDGNRVGAIVGKERVGIVVGD